MLKISLKFRGLCEILSTLFFKKTQTCRKVKITHVGMYLGIVIKDNRAVMICATRGRSYRGVPRDGFGSAPLPEKKGGEKE